MENMPTPEGKEPNSEKLTRLSVDLSKLRELFDKDIPSEHEQLWLECREEIEAIEDEYNKGLDIAREMGELSEENTEFYLGFISAYEDQIEEIYKKMKKVEELYYTEIPQKVLERTRKLKQILRDHSN